MHKFILKISNLASLTIYTDMPKVIDKLFYKPESLTKTIPALIYDIGEVNVINESGDYITLFNHVSKSAKINRKDNIAELICPEKEFFFPDLVYLAIAMLANELQSRGCYFIQSAVVKYDDEHSIMLLGDPNAGKTSLAYTLMRDNGYKLISNDNILVGIESGRLKTYAGTRNMQMRYGGIKLYFPEILPYVSVPEEDKGRDDWDIKLYIDDYLQAHEFEYADESIVTDIYNIMTFKSGDTFIRKRERIDEELLVYEHLTKQIRSNRYVLISHGIPLPSFENERYLQERYSITKRICDTTNVYDARGSLDEISRLIRRK